MSLARILLLLAAWLWPVSASAENRHALVIGIDTYDNVAPLQKARADAIAVSQALSELGFLVTTRLDTDRRSFNQAISEFTALIAPGNEAVFYFAGHGIEVNGRNYLLPADIPRAAPGDEDFVTGESIAVDRVLQSLQRRGARVSLLILDACRDNPFPQEGTRSLGTERGLARMDPPEGAFILFSAGTGQAALDRLSDTDPDPNSVFTRALIPRLQQPGLSIHELTQEVRRDVRELARTVRHDQFPAYYDQLSGVFMFRPDGAEPDAPRPPETIAAPVAPAAPDPCDRARRDWAVLQTTSSVAALESFIAQYEQCPIFVALAQERLAGLAAPSAITTPAPAEPTTRSVPPPNTHLVGSDICSQHWYQRNLIFHNNGFCFQTDLARRIFDTSQCWTRSPSLTAAENRRVQEIHALERQHGC
jgi:hypothetical protein